MHRHAIERYRISAHLCAQWAEFHRDRENYCDPFLIEDFLPGYKPSEPPVEDAISAGEMAFQRMRLINQRLGGEDLTRGINIQIMDRG